MVEEEGEVARAEVRVILQVPVAHILQAVTAKVPVELVPALPGVVHEVPLPHPRPKSNVETVPGSSTPRGSNGRYAGGASTPYRAGGISPLGVRPLFLAPFIFWWPFYWGPYGAYVYHLNDTVPAAPNNTAHNATDDVLCVCQAYDQCGCDDADSSYTPTNYTYTVINGTEYAIINGTLENDTSATSAAGESMGLYLTRSGTWSSWVLFGAITWAFVQAV